MLFLLFFGRPLRLGRVVEEGLTGPVCCIFLGGSHERLPGFHVTEASGLSAPTAPLPEMIEACPQTSRYLQRVGDENIQTLC